MRYLHITVLLISSFIISACNAQIESETTSMVQRIDAISADYTYDSGDVVKRLYLDKAGDMWICTTKEGVYKYNGNSFTNISRADGLCSNHVDAIIEDHKGTIWFGTDKGLCHYDGNSYTTIPLPQDDPQDVSPLTDHPSRSSEVVLSLIQARSGDFWVGSDGSGAYSYDGKSFTPYVKYAGRLQSDSTYNNCITSILEDSKGHIWISSFTHGGLTEYDGDQLIHHALKDGYGDGMVSTSYMDSEGHLWFGTRNSGIYRYNGVEFKNIKDASSGESIAMACMVEDRNGLIWIGSFARKGVYTYDGTSITPLDIDGSDLLYDIKCIAMDKAGHIWFGGRYGLLWRYDGNELKDFTQAKRAALQ